MNGYTAESGKISGYKDVHADKWYYSDIAKALAAGYISGTSAVTMSPESRITKQEAVVIIDKIKGISPSEDLSALSLANDGQNTAGWAKGYVAAAVKEGLLGGSGGNINPLGNITRAETVVLLDRVYTDTRIYNFAAQYGPESGTATIGSAVISSPGAVLKNTVVKGDVEISEEVGEGNVTLENVVVEGDVHVYGGGINSIIFNSVDVKGALVVNKSNGNVRILATGATSVSVTVLESGAIIVTKELTGGGFETVEISADIARGQNIVFDGNFKSIVNNLKDADITVNGTVKEFTANENANITGKAVVEKTIASENISVKLNGKDVAGTASPTPGGGGGGGTTVAVTGVSISENDFSLKVGEKKTLTAAITPSGATNKNVTWSSGNPEIAAVSAQGEVTAKAVGKAVITVTTVSGSKTDTVTVTVKPALPQITPAASKVEESKITTSSGLTAVQVANSKKLTAVSSKTGENEYEIKINAGEALQAEDGQKKAYVIISLKEDGSPADTSGITASLTATGSAVGYTIKFGEGLAEDVKEGSFLFEIGAGNPEALKQYVLEISKEGYSDLVLNIVYIPDSVAEITGIGNITGEITIGSLLTAGEITYNKISEDNPSYQWYRSEEAGRSFAAIEGAAGKTYTLTESDSGKYIKVKAAADGVHAYGFAESSVFGPAEKTVTAEEVFSELETVYLGGNTSASSIIKDLNLVTSLAGYPGVTIAWASDNPAVSAADGKITRDDENDTIVKLTAALSGKVTGSREYEVIVRMESLENVGIVGNIDEKFVEGYPQAYVKDGTVWVKFMLKEDAEMYMVVNGMNGDTESDAQAVFEGHAGTDGESIWVDTWPYFEAEANELVEFDTYAGLGGGNYSDECRIEFAVKTKSGYISSEPTTILFSSEVAAALDTAPPYVEGIFISKDLDEIYVYFDEEIDTASIPSASDFTLHDGYEGSETGNVKPVTELKNLGQDAWPASYIKLGIEGITQDNIEELTLKYNGGDIRDTSDAKNALIPADTVSGDDEWDKSIKYRDVISSAPYIENIKLSHDRKNMIINVSPSFNIDEYEGSLENDITVSAGEEEYSIADVNYSFNPENIGLKLKFANPLPAGNVSAEINTGGMKTYTYEDITGNLASGEITVIAAPGSPTANYDSGSKEINVVFNKKFVLLQSWEQFAHVFTLNVGGNEYKLRGGLLSTEDNQITISLEDLGNPGDPYYTPYYSQRFIDAIENGFNGGKTVQIKYDRPDGDNNYSQIYDAAGAPVPSFGYINITK